MKTKIWISYDANNYEEIYTWLDKYKAKECVGNLAFFEYEYEGDLVECLRSEIDVVLGGTKKLRIYVIWKDAKTLKTKGYFIYAGRKISPWTGYYFDNVTDQIDED